MLLGDYQPTVEHYSTVLSRSNNLSHMFSFPECNPRSKATICCTHMHVYMTVLVQSSDFARSIAAPAWPMRWVSSLDRHHWDCSSVPDAQLASLFGLISVGTPDSSLTSSSNSRLRPCTPIPLQSGLQERDTLPQTCHHPHHVRLPRSLNK